MQNSSCLESRIRNNFDHCIWRKEAYGSSRSHIILTLCKIRNMMFMIIRKRVVISC